MRWTPLDFPHSTNLKPNMVSLEDEADIFGPLQLRDLTWVGRMDAFLEIWKPNAMNKNAERQGDRKVSSTLILCCRLY